MEFELPTDFKELLELLNANDVRYLLVGGYAVGLHGYARATNDMDIFVGSDQNNAENLVRALTEFGFGEAALSVEIFTKKGSLIVMGVEPMSVDILNYLTGIDFEGAYKNRNIINVEEIEISLISLADLIQNKRETGRHKDLADIEYLKKIHSLNESDS